MTNWLHTLKLKDLLTEDEDPETVKRVAAQMHERLEAFRQHYYPWDIELEEVVDQFHSLAFEEESPTCRWFNNVMGDLYDWGDDGHRLWID